MTSSRLKLSAMSAVVALAEFALSLRPYAQILWIWSLLVSLTAAMAVGTVAFVWWEVPALNPSEWTPVGRALLLLDGVVIAFAILRALRKQSQA